MSIALAVYNPPDKATAFELPVVETEVFVKVINPEAVNVALFNVVILFCIAVCKYLLNL